MTKIDLALAKLRALPLERQEELADCLLDLVTGADDGYRLTDEQRAQIRLAQREVADGKVASEEKMEALWRRAGLLD